jgi:diguanylate cyclase (GGDEF)-like protein/PAS domain S-box-containing protein
LLPILLVGAFGLVAFYLYIRRSLQQFTPEQGVPERVRAAFDTLPPGVCILDNQGRIVLANRAVKCLQPVSTEDLLHKPLSSLDWLAPALPRDPAKHPWVTCLREQRPTPRELLRIPLASGKTVEALVSCAPIRDELGRLRGCLVTLDDVSDLYRVNERLLRALQELGSSQQRVQRQNEELYQLATRDVLTGCLNRRAFYEQAETLFARAAAQSAALACLLVDIDHFKRLNDEYGHLVGDQVIRSVAAVLSSGLREGDLLCRYGGEEFCILLPEATLEQAHQVAERLRLRIQKQVGPSLRVEDAPIVTGSFGIAMFDQDAELTVLIHRADQALYAAKNGGRNRVMLWPADSLSADPQVHAA